MIDPEELESKIEAEKEELAADEVALAAGEPEPFVLDRHENERAIPSTRSILFPQTKE